MESHEIADDKVNGIETLCKPCKFFATDLVASKLLPTGKWQLNTSFNTILPSTTSPHIVHDGTVWIQGIIVQTAPFSTIIIEDGTGKAKITYSTTVNDPMSWVKKGSYCMAIGKLLDSSSIPTVSAMKLVCLDSNALYKTMWKSEVEEVKYLLTNQIKMHS